MRDAPTSSLSVVLLEAFDGVWSGVVERLVGLDDAEYLWEPVDGCWSVRRRADGSVTVDRDDKHATPAPVTTIAWRTWHLAVDCLDSYSTQLFGRTGASFAGLAWTTDVAEARAAMDAAWAVFRAGVAGWSDDGYWTLLGPGWGPFARHNLLDLALHAFHEVVHHTAEIALLRDLYGARASR
jgi:DinB superfamily